ncbi:hypothetical protein M4S82_07460 [Planococcus sp. MERTA32b]|nr:hypothetical protein [Planococcus sp. MER TA 32b]
MTVYEALMFAVTFASLMLMISSKDLKKSESARSALKGIRRVSEMAFCAMQLA